MCRKKIEYRKKRVKQFGFSKRTKEQNWQIFSYTNKETHSHTYIQVTKIIGETGHYYQPYWEKKDFKRILWTTVHKLIKVNGQISRSIKITKITTTKKIQKILTNNKSHNQSVFKYLPIKNTTKSDGLIGELYQTFKKEFNTSLFQPH